MAFKSTIEVDKCELATLESVHFSINQMTNHQTNKPTSEVSMGSVSCEIRVHKNNLLNFFEWAMHSNEKRNGVIKYYKIDEDASLFELKFKDGFCTHFSSHLSAASSSDLTISIEISARSIELEEHLMEADW